jgi:hypothetical protein
MKRTDIEFNVCVCVCDVSPIKVIISHLPTLNHEFDFMSVFCHDYLQ